MNISPAKFQALTDKIASLEIQIAGILTIIGASKRERDPSIAGLCERHGFSIGTYKNLRKRGKAPVETRVSANRVIITEADEAAWIAARQEDARRIRQSA
jgi:hypothetical protein